jgi:hypothetical protein
MRLLNSGEPNPPTELAKMLEPSTEYQAQLMQALFDVATRFSAPLSRRTDCDDSPCLEGRRVMTFGPDSAAFVARLGEINLPRYETLSPEEARNAMAAARRAATIQPPSILRSREVEIPPPRTRSRVDCTARWAGMPRCRS